MKSTQNKNKHNNQGWTVFYPLLSLSFPLLMTTAYADTPQSMLPIQKRALPLQQAAGKPAPYLAPSRQAITANGTPTKPGVISPTKAAAGKPAAYNTPTNAAVGEQLVLQSREISCFGPAWQSFSDYLTVPKGCEKVPFFLTFTNGSNSNPRFQDIRVRLAGKSLATIKDFNGQPKLTRNLTGAVGVGDSLLVVQALGPAGAQLSWQFTTPKVEISAVTPKEVALNKPITITGKNFSDVASVNQVYFDKTAVAVTSATKTQLQVKVPSTLLGGKADVTVAVGPSRSKPFKITVKSAPKIDGVNMISTAPGQPVTITGQGFSTSTGDNQVYFGDVLAQIVSCTSTSITVIVPEPPDGVSYPNWGLPIKVKTNGVDSTDPEHKGTINIQLRVFDGTPSR